LSAKFSLHKVPFGILQRVKPFAGVACAWVGVPWNAFQPECCPSMIIGAKWVLNARIDCELKYVYDYKGYQNPLHFGFKINFIGIDPRIDGSKRDFIQSPNGYRPYYAHAKSLQKLRYTTLQSAADEGYTETVKALIGYGADIGAGQVGRYSAT
jgi:hypothetical protein